MRFAFSQQLDELRFRNMNKMPGFFYSKFQCSNRTTASIAIFFFVASRELFLSDCVAKWLNTHKSAQPWYLDSEAWDFNASFLKIFCQRKLAKIHWQGKLICHSNSKKSWNLGSEPNRIADMILGWGLKPTINLFQYTSLNQEKERPHGLKETTPWRENPKKRPWIW